MKNTKIKNLGIKIGVPLGVIAIAGAGTAGYFIGKVSTNQTASHYFNYKTSITLPINSGATKLIENPIGVSESESNKFFLSDNDLKILRKEIQDNLQYGPELSDIVHISIDDKNTVDEEGTLGAYIPSRDIININTEAWREAGLVPVSKDAENDPYVKTKIKLIFQVIFHEYGHFLADEYVNSEPKTSFVEKIYSFQAADEGEKNAVISGNWNKTFYSEFISLLNYDKNSDLGLNYISDNGYNVAKIYNSVNSPDPNKLVDDKNIDNTDKYYYSIDELFTRKYQLITMPLTGQEALYWEKPNGERYYSPYGVDFKKIKSDDPFPVSKDLYKLLGKQIGFLENNYLTHISIKNGQLSIGGYTNEENIKLLVDGKELKENDVQLNEHNAQVKLNKTAQIAALENEREKEIVNEKKPQNFYSNYSNTNFGGIDLNTTYNKDKAKEISSKDASPSNETLVPEASKYFWAVNSLNISDILNKSLSLLINGQEVPLSIRDSSEATISTYRSHQKNKKDYHVVNEKGIIKIVSGSGA